MNARDELLARLRAAGVSGGNSPARISREYAVTGEHPPGSPELAELLAERVADYRAQVHRTSLADLPGAVAGVLSGRRAARVGVPPGLPAGWVTGTEQVVDVDLAPDRLDQLDGVVTGCAVAIAVTGTLVLDGSAACGRRALTLVPDLHLCVVLRSQIVQSVPEALGRLDPRRPLTFVSGPSATSDIELDRVEGVHGPRTLDVLLVGDA